jgi:hypothetical protein
MENEMDYLVVDENYKEVLKELMIVENKIKWLSN